MAAVQTLEVTVMLATMEGPEILCGNKSKTHTHTHTYIYATFVMVTFLMNNKLAVTI
jgi:hypothetical protein